MIGNIVAERYTVIEHVGRGGMQDVYRAFDQLLESDVALKTPQAGQADKRFSQSAVIAARVNHHNVAKTLDYFADGDKHYLVEEFIAGETLDRKLNVFGAIDPHLSARIFLHIAKGVAASHHAGVVHRDLKPSNIIVEPGINLHALKITDFGIATLTMEVFDEAAQDGDLTRSTSGTVRGALPYMAPEMMFRAPGEHPAEPSDIWSLGALMFQILSGAVPFGFYLQAAVNVQNRNRAPWPRFITDNPQFKPLSLQLQSIIESCLQYSPEERPTADELVKEISELCFIGEDRIEGTVSNLIQNGYSGFITGKDNYTSFFSMESVYGPNRPNTSDKRKVCFSRFPGTPKPRAHPIIILK